jgi:hypothetical protein
LTNPRLYLLKLIQWAVASRPGEVRVEVNAIHVRVEHDGEPLKAGQLPADLLIGLRAAIALGASKAELSGPGWGFELGDGSPVAPSNDSRVTLLNVPRAVAKALASQLIQGLASVAFFGVFVALWSGSAEGGIGMGVALATLRTSKLAWGFLTDAPGLLSPEVTLARFRCIYADVPIYLNGKPVNKPYFGLKSTYRRGDGYLDIGSRVQLAPNRIRIVLDPDCRIPWPELAGATELPHLRMFNLPCCGVRAILQREQPGKHGYWKTRVRWVKDGVIVAEESQPSWPGGFQVVVCAHDLQLDPSEFKIVHDDRYLDLIAVLQAEVVKVS